MSSVADILDRAADLVEPEGAWTQGAWGLYEDSTCSCVVGAVGRALGYISILRTEAWIDAHAAFLIGMSADALEAWNDSTGRTQAEVVAKLREAAAKARENAL